MRFFVLALLAMSVAVASLAAAPSYPPQPTVTEYAVVPDWPTRPAELGPRAAVPGIAIDEQDNVWCVERGAVPVQVYNPAGTLVAQWGQGRFKGPHSVRFDPQGHVWIADFAAHVVQKFTRQGQLLLTLGTAGKAGDDAAHFAGPTDVAVTPAGDIFVSDGYGNRRVVHFDREGKFVKAWGSYGGGKGQFCLPHQVVLDSKGRLYVADRNSGRVMIFSQQGTQLDEWSGVMMPWGLWISKTDELWICGSSPQWWRKDDGYPPPKDQIFMRFTTDGRPRQVWTVPIGKDGAEKPGDCNWLHAVALDSKGNLYAGDINGKRLQKFVPQR